MRERILRASDVVGVEQLSLVVDSRDNCAVAENTVAGNAVAGVAVGVGRMVG